MSSIEAPTSEEVRLQTNSRPFRELSLASGQMTLPNRSTQDRILCLSASIPKAETHIPFGLLIAADGVSSTTRGRIAADIAVEVVSRQILKQILMPMVARRGVGSRQASIHETLRSSVAEANRKIVAMANTSKQTAGTTLTALLVMGSAAHLIHIGDSRAYVIEDGGIRQISTDHSVSARLDSIGQLGEGDNDRHVLYRALGVRASAEPQVTSFQLSHIHGFIVCTDGFWSAMPSERLAEVALEHDTARSLCNSLLSLPPQSLSDDASVIVGLFQEAAGSENPVTA